MRTLSLALLLCALADAKKPPEITLTPVEIAEETAWLKSLGVDASPLIAHPFTAPFTNRSFIAPSSRLRTARPDLVQVPADALRRDLSVLRAIMPRAYGGWASAEARGWNWPVWFEKWDHLLARHGNDPMLVQDAFAPFGELMAFQLDNHSGPLLNNTRFGSGSRTSIFDRDPDGSCDAMTMAGGEKFSVDVNDPGQQPRPAVLRDLTTFTHYLAYPEKRGEAALIHCGGHWIPVMPAWHPEAADRSKNILALAGVAADAPSFRVMSSTVSYLRLPNFTKENGERLRRLLPSLPDSAGAEKLLIVDLRGNDGGDAPLDELSRWLDPATVHKVFPINNHLANSCIATALHWGYTQFTILSLQPPISPQLHEEIQSRAARLSEPSAPGCPPTFDEQRSSWNYTQRVKSIPEHPRFLVLVDQACASDCELLTYAFAATSRAVIAGVNTFGMMQFIQPGYFLLPHSNVRFRLATGRSDPYGDGRSLDGYGFDVDLLLPDAADQTPGAILKLANDLASR